MQMKRAACRWIRFTDFSIDRHADETGCMRADPLHRLFDPSAWGPIRLLSERERQPLALVYNEETPVLEASRRMGIPESTARFQLGEAIGGLRKS